ncbi:hypothetical protein TeGR_g12999, partial [Tetraparma gracilis]
LIELIDICCGLMEYPAWVNEGLDQEEADELKKHRFFVGDTIEDCCRLLGCDAVLAQIGARIQKVVTRQQQQSPAERAQQWQGIESCLFAVKSVSKFIPKSEEAMIPHVMNLFQQQYAVNTTLSHLFRNTCNLLVGSYAAWIKAHPTYLESFFQFVTFGLNDPLTAETSAAAVRQLCECCNVLMGNPVLQLYEHVVASNAIELRDELQ